MKFTIILIFLALTAINAQDFLSDLDEIDPELKKYFPRWKIEEPDLQYQIYQYFKITLNQDELLDIQNIEVLAVPRTKKQINRKLPYQILIVTCGEVSVSGTTFQKDLSNIYEILSGYDYRREYENEEYDDLDLSNFQFSEDDIQSSSLDEIRKYSFKDIPVEAPVKPDQGSAIRDYLKPTNVNQALTLSLFDQSLKIGDTGFWIQNKTGNDQVGYPYYVAGESKFIMSRPLYVNNDPGTNKNTPYLINAHLGAVYRTDLGIQNGDFFSWLPERNLNTDPGGKLIFGMDIHMPFHPEAGIHLKIESPINRRFDMQINPERFATLGITPGVDFYRNDERNGDPNYAPTGVVPILQTTGQVTAFYNLWLNKQKAENYFRFDLGLSYAEVREYMLFEEYDDPNQDGVPEQTFYNITSNADGVQLFHPTEFADWLYAKVEYRNQAVFPFSVSLQYSNQIMLARAYMPLFGSWLLLEAKYATPLRDVRSYEVKNFFIISPVIRIAL